MATGLCYEIIFTPKVGGLLKRLCLAQHQLT
jgi:hypothetical protein